MNQLLLFALMNGSHRHRYTDASGICAACHRPHSPHTFENGVCSVCGFAGCEHPDGFVDNGNELTHVCPVCGATNPHAWFQQTTAVNCQACSVCGATRAHEWENGVCVVCDYSCQHPEWLPNGNRHKCKICALTAPHELSFAHDYNCQVCDVCGGPLIQRDDDRPETVRRRLEVYHQETEPLKGYYADKGVLTPVDNQPTIEGTTQVIMEALKG